MHATIRAARRATLALTVTLAAASLSPSAALACACGCGVFDIGDGTFMPGSTAPGLTVWFRYSTMDQNQNWEGVHKAPAADNPDKKILTNFFTVGGDYVINKNWTVMAELPIYDRDFISTDDGTVAGPAGSLYKAHITALGDLMITGLYTGLSPDRSTGLSLGIKLPTGDYTGPNGPLGGAEFDRDSLPGAGSTDVLVGAYHVGNVTRDGKLTYFVQTRYQVAFDTRGGYRPGNEWDSAAGVSYNLGNFGKVSRVAPVLQLINSERAHDTGAADVPDPLNSGYERLLITPGIEAHVNRVRIYADVALPVYQHTNAAQSVAVEGKSGQLVAPALFKIQLAYSF